jgi:hypothetical protein
MITKLLRYFALITVAAQFAAAATPEEEIRAVLARQTADWNRGSTDAFVEGYSAENGVRQRHHHSGCRRRARALPQRYRRPPRWVG